MKWDLTELKVPGKTQNELLVELSYQIGRTLKLIERNEFVTEEDIGWELLENKKSYLLIWILEMLEQADDIVIKIYDTEEVDEFDDGELREVQYENQGLNSYQQWAYCLNRKETKGLYI
jgi:hypothetical protein